jgi:hypothetical protein
MAREWIACGGVGRVCCVLLCQFVHHLGVLLVEQVFVGLYLGLREVLP